MRSSYDRYGKRGLLWDFGGWSPASPFSIFRGFFDEHGGHDIISTYLKSKGTHAEMPSDWDFLLMRLEEQQCLGDLPSGAVPVLCCARLRWRCREGHASPGSIQFSGDLWIPQIFPIFPPDIWIPIFLSTAL